MTPERPDILLTHDEYGKLVAERDYLRQQLDDELLFWRAPSLKAANADIERLKGEAKRLEEFERVIHCLDAALGTNQPVILMCSAVENAVLSLLANYKDSILLIDRLKQERDDQYVRKLRELYT